MFAIIVNPVAGGGDNAGLTEKIRLLLEARGEECLILTTKENEDAALQVRGAIRRGCGSVAVVGGDGTLSEIAGELVGLPVTLYLVPCGTGNDFARALRLPQDPLRAFEAQLDGTPRQIDCGLINGRVFLNVSGSGFDVEVLRKTEELKPVYPGEKAYHRAVLSVLGRYRAFEMEISVDGGAFRRERVTIVEIANGQCIGGGMRVAPRASVSDGLFDVVLVRTVPRLLIPLLLPLFMLGVHVCLPVARVVHARSVTLRSPGMTVNIDGRLVRMQEARYEILPGALRVMKPCRREEKRHFFPFRDEKE